MLRHATGLLLALALGLVSSLARADLYRWVDDLGVTHYTTDPDQVPRKFRDSETAIRLPPAPVSAPRAPRADEPLIPEPATPEAERPGAAEIAAPELAPSPPSAALPELAPSPPSAVAPEIAPPPPSEASPELAAPSPNRVAPELAPASPVEAVPAVAPASEPATAPIFPGPSSAGALSPDDPRAEEVAALEAQIANDRESLRQIISTKRWDSAELASDPAIREIAERLPRLQAQLAALRAEPVP